MNTTVEGTATTVKESPARRKTVAPKVAPDPAAAALVVVPPVAPTPMSMLDVAARRGATPEELKQWMDLHERWERTEARKAFVVAMAEFKKNPPVIRKNKHVKFGNTEYDHATLDNVCEQIISGLSAAGIHHKWTVDQATPGKITVTCVLTHVQGHSESVPLDGPADTSGSKNGIQAIGSTLTYLQRYSLLAVTGLAVGGQDDDGAGSGNGTNGEQTAKTEGKQPYPNEQLTKNLPAWRKLVADGAKTADQIVATVQSKYALTEEQDKRIRNAIMALEKQ